MDYKHSQSPLAKTIESCVVSILFSVMVGIALVLLAEIPIVGGPFRAIERTGTDAGMLLHTWYVQERLKDRISADGSLEPAYVFLDIGPSACDEFAKIKAKSLLKSGKTAELPEGCLTTHPAAPEIVSKVVKWLATASGAKPRVIVIDALLTDPAIDPKWPPPGYALFKDPVSAPTVAVAPTRWSGEEHTIWMSDIPPDPLRNGLLPPDTTILATTWGYADPVEDGDASVRRYWPAQLVGARSGDPSDRLMPTIGFAAAALAADRNDTFAVFKRTSSGNGATNCGADDTRRLAALFDLSAQSLCTQGYRSTSAGEPAANGPFILFSMPSLAAASVAADTGGAADAKQVGRQLQTSYDKPVESSVYRRVPVSFDPDNGEVRAVAADWLNDAIVVIGTSAASGNDWHSTPIGPMAGAEVILNAARSFRMFPAPVKPSLGHHLLQKIFISVLSSLIFAFAWLVIWLLVAWRERTTGSTGRFLLASAISLAFLVGIVSTMAALGYWQTLSLSHVVRQGYLPVDVFTPVFAVALEGFAEGAKVVLGGLEKLAAVLIAFVVALPARFATKPVVQQVGSDELLREGGNIAPDPERPHPAIPGEHA
jgi:CHASE2 domain-containing sensor protein